MEEFVTETEEMKDNTIEATDRTEESYDSDVCEEESSGSSFGKVMGGLAIVGALAAGAVIGGKKWLKKQDDKTRDKLENETGRRFKKIKTGRFSHAWVEDTDYIETAFDDDTDICNYVEED